VGAADQIADQIAGLQILQRDGVILLQQGTRRLVVGVAAPPLHLLVVALEQPHCLATTRAALRAATHAPLGFGELLFRCAVVTGICDYLPVGGDEKHL
jgi:hypothetical protein